MITLHHDQIAFSFPGAAGDTTASVTLMRTLRVPDDGMDWPLPPGLGRFPLRAVEDVSLPEALRARGGAVAPIAQAEAVWLSFQADLPVALKVAAGGVCALTGGDWTEALSRDPQNYAVVPGQRWLDGFKVAEGGVRQFVAMPLGRGYTAEEQLTGAAEQGGLQLLAVPMTEAAWARERDLRAARERAAREAEARMRTGPQVAYAPPSAPAGMGLGGGGRLRQEVYRDRFAAEDWDEARAIAVNVTLLNGVDWVMATGELPPPTPVTAEAYSAAGFPWFDHYDDRATALEATGALRTLVPINRVAAERGDALPVETDGPRALTLVMLRPED